MSTLDNKQELSSALVDLVRAGLTKLTEQEIGQISNHVIAEMASAAAGTAVDQLLGPLVRTLLRVGEVQQRDLAALLSEPAATGIRETNAALSIEAKNPLDAELVRERLRAADNKLSEAITLSIQKGDPQRAAFLYFMRGLIAQKTGAYAVALHDYAECDRLLEPLIREHDAAIERDRAEWSRRTFLTGELAATGYGATLRAAVRRIDSLAPAVALSKRLGPLREEATARLAVLSSLSDGT